MTIFYSSSAKAFFDPAIAPPPDDAVEITADDHVALMDAQASGKLIQPGADGKPEAVDPPAATIDLAAYARAKSYAIRTSGTTLNGMPVKTDADTLSLINGMAALAQGDNTSTFSFDTGGSVVTLTAEQAIAVSIGVGRWVQGTFTQRASVLADIAAGKLKTVADVDAAFAS